MAPERASRADREGDTTSIRAALQRLVARLDDTTEALDALVDRATPPSEDPDNDPPSAPT